MIIGWMKNRLTRNPAATSAGNPGTEVGPGATSITAARIGTFSGLIALGTVLTNLLFGLSLPPPLYEITLAPAFYFAIAILYPRKISFWSTAVGSAVGEMINIFIFGEASAVSALTFVPGIVLARAPEVLIVYRFRQQSIRVLSASMVLATIYESVVFFLIDWPVYSFTLFYGSGGSGLLDGLILAAPDFATMIDIVWIPLSLLLIRQVRKAYNTTFFD